MSKQKESRPVVDDPSTDAKAQKWLESMRALASVKPTPVLVEWECKYCQETFDVDKSIVSSLGSACTNCEVAVWKGWKGIGICEGRSQTFNLIAQMSKETSKTFQNLQRLETLYEIMCVLAERRTQ